MQYTEYFAIEKKFEAIGLKKHRSEWVAEFTDNRKDGLSQLTHSEYKGLIAMLNTALKSADKKQSDKELPQRRKVIALLCQIGYTTPENKPDMKRINDWCITYGNAHKNLSGHRGANLTQLVTQAQERYTKFLKGI